ncbi:MAG TPA: ATP-binding cassette domain-containing protein [Rectinemataceae bacterium]|nr:ATP-binding cassette domain-containing protein [Rectinemataceae bacterium]
MRVELREITKTFGSLRANDAISLDVASGAVQGLLGENGAGKSTLMKILSGFISHDSGEILLDGEAIDIASPADAIRQGIGMLHQDPLDFPPFRLLEDFMLGASRAGGGGGAVGGRKSRRSKRQARKDFIELSVRFGFDLDPDAWVDSLTVGERQQLEILRLLWLGAKVLILDEPTTGISLPQKEKLFATLKKLAAEGMTILFVTHKLEDAEYLCDQVAVLRMGKLVGSARRPLSSKDLVALMFGKELPRAERRHASPGRSVLSVKGAAIEGPRLSMAGLDLEVRAGEIIGLAGMEGSGQSLFLGACGGLVQPVAGSFCLDEDERRDMTGRTHHEFRKAGVAWLPAARLEQGLVPGLSLTEHFILSEGMKGLFIDRKRAHELAESRIAAYHIKGKPESSVESLSGGNQQRALLALMREPLSLILVEHPTRGLDIESTAYIWGKLRDRCAEGTSIIFISSDLDEILEYSDRVLVFYAGRVSPPIEAESLTVERLGGLIGGAGWESLEGKGSNVA